MGRTTSWRGIAILGLLVGGACWTGRAVGQATGGGAGVDAPPWPVVLGARVAICERNRPVVSRVVLVPDADTWLQEVGRWSPAGQWPVLFESDPMAAAFIRAFAPEEVVTVPSTDRRLPAGVEGRQAALRRVASSAWGATDPDRPQRERFDELGWTPPGFVVTATTDPAWPAAVALAAGRGLPLAFLEDELGPVNGELRAPALQSLAAGLRELAEDSGYAWNRLGDDLDAVAICRSMPVRCRTTPPAAVKVELPGVSIGDGPFATTDALGRLADGRRWAYVGWIFGDESRSAAMAMASLFLKRTDAWFVSGYPETGGWARYRVSEAAAELSKAGYKALSFEGEQASLEAWHRLLLGGVPADMLYLNSHGMAYEFHLHEDRKARPHDMPILQRPAALSMVHSFSMQKPADPNTVGGRALDRGFYACIGSVDEPYLTAFVPPLLQSRRIRAGVPFLLAGRWWPGEGAMSGLWKVTTIGDPFMIAPPPGSVPIPRIAAGAVDGVPDSTSILDRARAAMASLDDEPTNAGTAIAALLLAGREDVALDLWRTVLDRGDAVAIRAAAPVVLDPLFRARRWDDFVDAYGRIPAPDRTRLGRDMLWHLAGPRLAGLRDPIQLVILRDEIRTPHPEVDLERIMPHLDRVLGEGSGRAELERRISAESNNRVRDRLKKLR